jgi:DNA-binding NarL/FixJ family response regulator
MVRARGSAESRIRVLVADDNRIHTQLLADALRRNGQLEVIGLPSCSDEVIEAANLHKGDVVVISANLDQEPLRGFEVLRHLRTSNPEIRAVMLLESSNREIILRAFHAGARGIFSRHESVETLSKCIRSVHHGQIWANSEQMSYAVQALASAPILHATDANVLNLLSKRELEVVRCLAEGLTNREIAERLRLSQHTIKNYLFRMFDKLGVSSRVGLVFMTLSHAKTERAGLADFATSSMKGDYPNEADFAICKKAAEGGVPAAQFALAQMYWSRRSDPEDIIQAYMWYLIATDQLSGARIRAGKSISPEQRMEAEQRATAWLVRKRGIDPDSSGGFRQEPDENSVARIA